MGELSVWDLNVSHEQLAKPSPDFVIAIYNTFLEQVTGINHQTLHEPIQSALNTLEDPNTVGILFGGVHVELMALIGPLCRQLVS